MFGFTVKRKRKKKLIQTVEFKIVISVVERFTQNKESDKLKLRLVSWRKNKE